MTMQKDPAATSAPPAATGSISGTINFQDVRQPANNVTVYIRVQDTSRADAPASTVAEQVLRGVNIGPETSPTPFIVQGIPDNPHARHTVRVHADLDGNGVVTRGDYVSTQSYPVSSGGPSGPVTIVAREVK